MSSTEHPLPLIVGLGGSAGSLSPLRDFFQNTPADSGMAYVVILHLSPEHESLMVELLQKSTTMRVAQAEDNVVVKPDTVYVIPPGKQLASIDGRLRLSDLPREHGKRTTVDLFFRTLAETHGDRAAVIVLSGADGDGAIGIKRIKEEGGLTLVQDPGEAEFPGMPNSAIATGMVDFVLPAGKMPARLMNYYQLERQLMLPPGENDMVPASPADETELNNVLGFLRSKTARDFSCYKRATILRRISRRMLVNGMVDLADYYAFLQKHPAEAEPLLQDLLISVTDFFRDKEAFEALESRIPELFKGKGPNDTVRTWVAGCATGEEAYSVVILLSEHARKMATPPLIQVFATDLDENAIQTARDGIYPETIMADVSAERLARNFIKEENGYRIRPDLREKVLFALHDLLKDSPFSRQDMITCRNLLIYLNRPAQVRALDIFHYALYEEGKLFLGSSETIEEGGNLFSVIDKKNRIYQRRASPRQPLPASLGPTTMSRIMELKSNKEPGAVVRSLAALSYVPRRPAYTESRAISWGELHLKLLERLASPSALVGQNHEIIHLSEKAGRFLVFGAGEPTRDLLRAVHPDLRIGLRTALYRAAQTGSLASVVDLPLELDGNRILVDILAAPAGEIAPGYLLVVFDTKPASGAPATGDALATGETIRLDSTAVMRDFERELDETKGRLRETVEQYETSMEELKSGNEELQAMNEELRATSEELETSREELQSINEELTTVNQELKRKVDDLARANSDWRNLISSTDIATIFVDRSLYITRFTPTAGSIFNIIESDTGRPLSHITHRLDYPGMIIDADHVLQKLTPVEREVSMDGSRWFLARILPYRAGDDKIAGVVLTFIDITERRKLEDFHLLLAAAVQSSEDAIITKTLEGVITSWNKGAERIFGYKADEVAGRSITLLIPPERASEELDIIKKVSNGEVVPPYETVRMRKDGTRLDISLSVSPLRNTGGEIIGASKIVRDITEHKRAEQQLIAAKAAAEKANKAKDDFLAVLSHELRTPLNPALSAADYLADHEKMPEEFREDLNTIRRNILLEARLMDDLLDLQRITRGKIELHLEPLDAHQLIRNTLAVLHEDFSARKIDVALDLAAAAHHIEGDSVRMQQVIWNVANNAIKFTPPEGRVTIRTHNENNRLILEIADTGIGLEPGHESRIFNAFEQGERSITREFGGLGLGLAISKSLLDLHGGTISAHSPGKYEGTTFRIALPSVAAPQVAGSQPPREESADSADLDILLVDDHADTLRTLKKLLTKRGHHVSTASCVEGARELLESRRFDLLISDIGLPDRSGYDLIREAKQRQPLKGIAMSGFGMAEDLRRSMEAGFDFHLVKPVNFHDLDSKIRSICQGSL